jgi:hypothetical protein
MTKRCATKWGAFAGWFVLAGCASAPAEEAGVTPRRMADALHAVMEADRTVYTKTVVNRLQNEEKVIKASEHWQDDKALPLPAQMFRMGSETAAQKNQDFSYALLSQWAVNKQNAPNTEAEQAGLKHVSADPTSNYYSEETLGGRKYFTAVYPDIAVAPACVTCHNAHKDSPRTDFAIGDVMGGVVVRIPLS